jgi:F-type H+-transporting ATPase subunit alpha
MNPGISVSRVGGAAQTKAMKKVSGGLRLQLAAFRALEAFAQLGTDLDPATQAELDRGYRMVELLKQPQYQPLSVAEQVISIYAGTNGHLDDVAVKEVQRFEKELLQYVHDKHSSLISDLTATPALSDEIAERIVAAVKEFKTVYKPATPAA